MNILVLISLFVFILSLADFPHISFYVTSFKTNFRVPSKTGIRKYKPCVIMAIYFMYLSQFIWLLWMLKRIYFELNENRQFWLSAWYKFELFITLWTTVICFPTKYKVTAAVRFSKYMLSFLWKKGGRACFRNFFSKKISYHLLWKLGLKTFDSIWISVSFQPFIGKPSGFIVMELIRTSKLNKQKVNHYYFAKISITW